MSKQYYTDEQCLNIEHQADMVSTDLERLDPETFETKADAQAAWDNILMGLYNLADDMGLSYE